MMSANRLWWATAMSVLLLAATLVGCAPQGEDLTVLTQVEARAEIDTLFTGVQDQIGGDWKSLDSPPEECALSGGRPGVRFVLARRGVGVPLEEQSALVDRVVSLWTAAGFAPTLSQLPEVDAFVVTQVRYPESGYDGVGIAMELWISTTATSLDGLSRCGVVDAELN